ncbi:unnamed protein product [Camellia sinensis]
MNYGLGHYGISEIKSTYGSSVHLSPAICTITRSKLIVLSTFSCWCSSFIFAVGGFLQWGLQLAIWRLYHSRLLFGIPEDFRDRVSKYPNYFRVMVEDDEGGGGWLPMGEVLEGHRRGGTACGMKIAEKKLGAKR